MNNINKNIVDAINTHINNCSVKISAIFGVEPWNDFLQYQVRGYMRELGHDFITIKRDIRKRTAQAMGYYYIET